MFDAVVPTVMSEAHASECPACKTSFTPKRCNQRYCSRACQHRYSRNASRGNRDIEYRQRTRRHHERAHRLAELIYSAQPQNRLGVMQSILEAVPHDAGLRNILKDPKLHKQPPRADGRMNIAKAANAYTQKFFGLSIKRYIAVRVREENQKASTMKTNSNP